MFRTRMMERRRALEQDTPIAAREPAAIELTTTTAPNGGEDRIMKRTLKVPLLLLAAALAIVVAACGGGSNSSSNGAASSGTIGSKSVNLTQGSGLKFAMVTHGDNGQFWSTVKKGAEDGAKQEGVQLTYQSSSQDPQKQAQYIKAAVSQKVDGLAVSDANPDAIRNAVQEAVKAGIPVISLNSGESAYKSIGAMTHVGQDEIIAGRAVGQRMKSEGVKKILCVIQEQGNIALEQRCQGVKQGFGGTVININVKGDTDLATSQTEMQTKLEADKSIDGVVTLESSIANAAISARQGAHSNAKQATFDLSPEVLKAIQSGKIEFAVDQQPYLQGYLPIVFLKLYKENLNTVGGGQPVLTGPSFVDKANAASVAKLANAGTR